MKILVTGSNGMLGKDLCALLSRDHKVIGVDIAGDPGEGRIPTSFYEADITFASDVEGVFKVEKPDIVVHAAAWTDVDGCEKDPARAHKVNVEGTKNVARAAEKASSGILALSTDYVFDGRKGGPYTEKDTPNPLSVYGRTKLDAEDIIRKTSSRYLVVRTSALFGRSGRNFVDTIIDKASGGGGLKVVKDQVTSPTYTLDLASAIKLVIEKGSYVKEGVLNICNSGICSWYEFALEILRVSGIKDAEVAPITSRELARPAERPAYSVLDNGKFYALSKTELRPWEKALKEYVGTKTNMGGKE